MAERRPIFGPLVGILVFLFGVGLILWVFQMAFQMYQTPPLVALNVNPDQPIKLNDAAVALVKSFFQVVVLIVMATIGSIIAGRGIKMYSAAPRPEDRPVAKTPKETKRPKESTE